jgi:hypothetical protein
MSMRLQVANESYQNYRYGRSSDQLFEVEDGEGGIYFTSLPVL